MVKQTCMLLSAVLHVLTTEFSKNSITRRTAYGTRDDSPSFLCTDSMCACSSFVQLSKTISEYSKPGLINDLYKISSVFRLTFREMLLSMLILVFALAQILSIWVPYFKFCCITMPRCLWCLTWDIGSSKKNKFWDSGLPRKARAISHDLD